MLILFLVISSLYLFGEEDVSTVQLSHRQGHSRQMRQQENEQNESCNDEMSHRGRNIRNRQLNETQRENIRARMRKLESRVLDYCEENYPEFHGFLNEIKEEDNHYYKKCIYMISRNIVYLRQSQNFSDEVTELVERDFELEMKVLKSIYEYNNEENEENKNEIESQIKSYLNSQFDIRHKLFECKVENQRSRLEQLESDLTDRVENKKNIVNNRFKLLSSPPQKETVKSLRQGFDKW